MSSYKNYGGYQSTAGGDAANDFARISQTIATNVQKISQNVSSMQRMVNQLGTAQDSEHLRSQLHTLQHSTNQLAKETNSSLKEMSNMPQSANLVDNKQRRMQRERLTSDFSDVLKNFQVIQRTAAQKEKESVIRARAASHSKQSQGSGSSALIDLESGPSFQQRQSQQQSQLQLEEEVDVEELREREKSIRKIESDIVDVNQIFKDLATMVHAQGEVIDSIEANVETATIQVSEGATQIAKAREYQTRARKKTFCLIGVLLVVVIGVALLIYFTTK